MCAPLLQHDLVVGDANAGAFLEVRKTLRLFWGVAGLPCGRQGLDVPEVVDRRLLKVLEEAGDEEVLTDFPAVAITVPLDRMEEPDDGLIDLSLIIFSCTFGSAAPPFSASGQSLTSIVIVTSR